MRPLILVHTISISFQSVRMLIGAFSVLYLLEHGITTQELGWLKGFQALVMVVIDIPLSHYADQHSRKLSVVLSIACAAVWLFLTGIGNNFETFLLAEFFNALSMGLMSGTFASYLYDVAQSVDREKKALDIFAAYNQYNFLFMGLVSLAGAAMQQMLTVNIWLLAAGIMILILICSLMLPADPAAGKHPQKDFFSEMRELAVTFTSQSSSLLRVLYGNLALALIGQVLIQYWQVLLPASYMANVSGAGLVFFAILISQAFASLCSRKTSGTAFITGCATVTALVSFVVVNADYPQQYTIPLTICLLFFVFRLLANLSVSVVLESTPRHRHSTLLSSLNVMSRVGSFVTLPLAALLLDKVSSFFLILAAVGLLLMTRLIGKKKQSDLPQEERQ